MTRGFGLSGGEVNWRLRDAVIAAARWVARGSPLLRRIDPKDLLLLRSRRDHDFVGNRLATEIGQIDRTIHQDARGRLKLDGQG